MLLQAEQMCKMTSISLKIVKVVILSVAQLVTTVIFFSAGDKSRVKWDNSRNLTQKMRTIDTHEPEPVDPDLLAAGVETLFCCWPKRLKRWVALRKVFSSHKYVADHDCTIEMQSNT